jgi:hypothetical protein
MKITQDQIKNQINNCFEAFDPRWLESFGTAQQKNSFKQHLEKTAGIKVEIENDYRERMSYRLASIEVVDESKLTWWILKWS